jgi:hypothetical protein
MDGADTERAETDQLAAAVEGGIAYLILRGQLAADAFDNLE